MVLNIVKSSFMSVTRPQDRLQDTRAVFLDMDGTLIEPLARDADPARIRFTPGAREALTMLGALDYRLIVVSNQPGVGLGHFGDEALAGVEAQLSLMFAECGARLGGFSWCPHAPQPSGRVACVCRLPMPGLLQRASTEFGVRLADSWMIGDLLDDVEAGHRAGCRTILLAHGHEVEAQEGPHRAPDYLVHGLDDAARVIAESQAPPIDLRAAQAPAQA